MTFEVGHQLSHYRILSHAGEGGMGQVYRAVDLRLDRVVALKILPASLTHEHDRVNRFIHEAKAASALNHPNIVTIYEIGVADGTHYIAMEWVDGETLRQKLDHSSRSELMVWFTQVADSIGKAHERGIVHRDLKPENVMINSDGQVKILDFGLAKLNAEPVTGDSDTVRLGVYAPTREGVIVGTPGYMSPEQVQGRPIDIRSDVFSLGAILYEIVTGRQAFSGDSLIDTLHRIIYQELVIPADMPEDIAAVLRKSLAKLPEDRYPTARHLAMDLPRVTAELPALGAMAVRRKKKWMPLAIAATLAALAIAAVVLSNARGRGHQIPRTPSAQPLGISSVAVLPFAANDQLPETEYVATGMSEALGSALARLNNVRVIASSSTASYAGRPMNARQIATQLGVDAILSGVVRQRAGQVTVTAELVRAKDDYVPWRVERTQSIDAVRALEQSISAEVVAVFGAAPAQPQNPPHPDAHRLYLQARHHWNKRTNDGIRTAMETFNKALDADATYAPAYAGLADCYAVADLYVGMPSNVALPKARAAAQKALELDPSLAEAHTTLAYVHHYYDRNWVAAEAEYRRALQLKPSYATAHQWYAELLLASGRFDEAKREVDAAMRLDPLSPTLEAAMVWTLYMVRDYPAAIARGQQATAAFPDFPYTYGYLALAYSANGDYAQARGILEAAVAHYKSPAGVFWLAMVLAREGKRPEAARLANDTAPAQFRYYHAYPYIALGDHAKALDALEKAHEENATQLVWMKIDPVLDPLRADPRFQALLAKVEGSDTRAGLPATTPAARP